MGHEVTLYSFVPEQRLFEAATWSDDNSYSRTLKPLRQAASTSCDLDRRFDWLDWVLRKALAEPISSRAINGRAQIAPGAVAGQGFQIRWNDTETCTAIADIFSKVSLSTIRSKVNCADMSADHLYKFGQWDDENVVAKQICDDFIALRDFYAAVAVNCEAALIYKD
jgi:Domain of unknown function (DUF1877)